LRGQTRLRTRRKNTKAYVKKKGGRADEGGIVPRFNRGVRLHHDSRTKRKSRRQAKIGRGEGESCFTSVVLQVAQERRIRGREKGKLQPQARAGRRHKKKKRNRRTISTTHISLERAKSFAHSRDGAGIEAGNNKRKKKT